MDDFLDYGLSIIYVMMSFVENNQEIKDERMVNNITKYLIVKYKLFATHTEIIR